MIFAFDYEAFLKDLSLCCSADSLGRRAIPQSEIRLVRVSWRQESGVKTAGVVCDVREQ